MERELINPVETENAIYEVVFGLHIMRNREPIDGIDALVTESGAVDRERDWPMTLTYHVQTKDTVEACHDARIPVFCADIASPASWGGYRVEIEPGRRLSLEDIARAMVLSKADRPPGKRTLDGWKERGLISEEAEELAGKLRDDPEIYTRTQRAVDEAELAILEAVERKVRALISKEPIPYDTELVQANEMLHKPGLLWRDAIVAYKCEETLAPLLADELGHKPLIRILFGAGHMGIVDCLEDSARRDELLAEMYTHGLDDVDEEDLYTISRADAKRSSDFMFYEDGWDRSRIETDKPFAID